MLVEFSLVTHASASPHMHVVLHNSSFCYLVNPKHCSCLFVCFIFSYPPDRILPVPRNVRCPPWTTSWSPAGRKKWKGSKRGWMRVGERGVTLQWCRDQRKKKLMKKKMELIGERGSLEADRRTEKEKRKCHKDPQPNENERDKD